jgi:hypothetical protein
MNNSAKGQDLADQFMQGGGSFSAISATTTTPAGGARLSNLGVINGLTFFGTCANSSSSNTGAQITLRNGTNNAITFLRDEVGDVTSEVLQPNDQDGDMPVQAETTSSGTAAWAARGSRSTPGRTSTT